MTQKTSMEPEVLHDESIKDSSIKMSVAKRLDNIGEYYFSQKLREIDELNKAGKQVINLGIGSPDLPPHDDVIKVLQQESTRPNTHAYQNYKGSPILRIAIAKWYKKWYNVDLNADTEILPLIGSKEGIMHICMTYVNEGDAVLIPNPGYPTYRSAAKIAGASLIEYVLTEQNSWFPDFEELEKNDLSKVRLMFVNYPHMPTGQLPTKYFFTQLISFAKKHNILLCHDNPYSFILNKNPQSILEVDGAKDVA
ncbi:MAG: aminotransferase class I/II-fold pyridoxal phosphate-dependent enzyme, partial [Ginsengibacter sp.]